MERFESMKKVTQKKIYEPEPESDDENEIEVISHKISLVTIIILARTRKN